MSRHASLLLVLAATLPLAACPGDDPPPAWLSRVTAEPAGANCAAGGDAIQLGPDEDGDGVLDAGEVESTQYRCSGEAPPLLTRTDVEPAGANCGDGGSAVHAGRDGDGDGVLDDSEIEHTTYACEVDTVWEGPLSVTADNAAAVAHIRVVTGNLNVYVEDAPLAALEIVGGDVYVDEPVGSSALAALTLIGGTLHVVDTAHLPALETIGGGLTFLYGAGGAVFEAPALETIGGGLSSVASGVVAVRLPALESIGGDLDVQSSDLLTELALPALVRIGGSLIVQHNDLLTAIDRMPSLETVAGQIEIWLNDGLRRVELPALATVGDRVHVSDDELTTVAMPLLAATNAVYVSGEKLADVDLGGLYHVPQVHISGNVGALGAYEPGTIDRLDLTRLHQVDGLSLRGFDQLVELELPNLAYVSDQLFIEGLGAITHIDIPELREATDIWIQHGWSLKSVTLSRYGEVAGVRYLSLVGVGPLDGEDNVMPRQVRGSTWLTQSTATSLQALASIERTGYLRIDSNDDLRSLAGLHPDAVIEHLEVSDHEALTSLDGLESITAIGGDVDIARNPALVDLGGLRNLALIAGALDIGANDALTSLAGLAALRAVGGALDLSDNRRLPASEIQALRARLGR
jgi:hypothetical protein